MFKVSFIILSLFLFSCSTLHSGEFNKRENASEQSFKIFDLTIIHTNDLHGMLLPFNYTYQPEFVENNVGGVARRATLIKKIKADAKNDVLVLDAGDTFTRGPWHQKYFGKPEIEVLNKMNYDAATIGNNEFKATSDTRSQDVLLNLILMSKFPWLAANWYINSSKDFAKGVQPYIIKEIHGIKVGILGLTAIRSSTYPQTSGWFIENPIEVAKYYVPEIRKQCDILIALTHIGVNEEAPPTDNILAEEVEGIDAIIGGDSHTFITEQYFITNKKSLKKVPIVQTGEQGIRLGKFDLSFEKNEDGKWNLVKSHDELIKVDSKIKDDEEINEILKKYNIIGR